MSWASRTIHRLAVPTALSRKVVPAATDCSPGTMSPATSSGMGHWLTNIHRSAREHGIDEAELVIHAMKARPQYFDLLPCGRTAMSHEP